MNRTILLVFVIVASIGCGRAPVGFSNQAQSPARPAQELPETLYICRLLPVGETDAMALELQPSEAVARICEKMALAIAEKPEWLRSHIRKYKNLSPGESLPYHENFGVTEEEYDIQGHFYSTTPLTPSMPCTLVVRDEGSGRLIIDIVGDPTEFAGMHGLVIDTKKMSVIFDGITTKSWKESESPPDAPYRVGGIRWKTESLSPNGNNSETLFVRVGTNLENGNGILMFRVLQVVDGQTISQGEINIEWTL